LNAAQYPGDGPQYPRLRAGGHASCKGRLTEQAPVARRTRKVGENLPLEAQDAPLGERLACHDAGVVDEILGGKIVRAIHDKVIFSDNIQDIICRKVLMIGVDVDMGGIFRSFSPAESTLLRPTSGVKWITWRCRLESSTVSPSAMPIIPTPVAAR